MLSVVANCRYITILTAGPDTADSGTRAADTDQEIVDLKTLRAIRVLRPLKLVSGVPSKSFLPSRYLAAYRHAKIFFVMHLILYLQLSASCFNIGKHLFSVNQLLANFKMICFKDLIGEKVLSSSLCGLAMLFN